MMAGGVLSRHYYYAGKFRRSEIIAREVLHLAMSIETDTSYALQGLQQELQFMFLYPIQTKEVGWITRNVNFY